MEDGPIETALMQAAKENTMMMRAKVAVTFRDRELHMELPGRVEGQIGLLTMKVDDDTGEAFCYDSLEEGHEPRI